MTRRIPIPPPGTIPPHSLEAERAVLGAVLLNNDLLSSVAKIVTAEDFYRPSHGIIYRAFERLTRDGSPCDLITVQHSLETRGELETVGGLAYIASLLDGIPKSPNIVYHTQIVLRKARRRRIMQAAETLNRAASNGKSDASNHENNDDLIPFLSDLAEAGKLVNGPGHAIDLWSPAVTPVVPAMTVQNLIRRKGLHLVWAPPGGLKTFLLLRWVHELLAVLPLPTLTGHPELRIQHSYTRVLWISTEESTGALRYRAEMVRTGLGKDFELGGKLFHMFASQKPRITLDDLPSIIETEGPFNAIILDSLTGLRPKTKNGVTIKWDADNDAANEACLELRGLSEQHEIAFTIVHHTGREISKGYRGPTDWWASADIMFGLVTDNGSLKVLPEKNRDGKLLPPFHLTPSWGAEGFYVTYGGQATSQTISGIASEIQALIGQQGPLSQAAIANSLGCPRSTARDAIRDLVKRQVLEWTGISQSRSPVYGLREVAEP